MLCSFGVRWWHGCEAAERGEDRCGGAQRNRIRSLDQVDFRFQMLTNPERISPTIDNRINGHHILLLEIKYREWESVAKETVVILVDNLVNTCGDPKPFNICS